MDKTDMSDYSKIVYISNNLEDTDRLAKKVASILKGGEVILLNGELGAGKTAFTKCLAKHLGVEEIVTSPTFTFMKEYNSGRIPLYHFDMYRASDEDELYELGLNDYLYMNGVCVIEWNKIEGIKNPIVIDISSMGESSRRFEISGVKLDL